MIPSYMLLSCFSTKGNVCHALAKQFAKSYSRNFSSCNEVPLPLNTSRTGANEFPSVPVVLGALVEERNLATFPKTISEEKGEWKKTCWVRTRRLSDARRGVCGPPKVRYLPSHR